MPVRRRRLAGVGGLPWPRRVDRLPGPDRRSHAALHGATRDGRDLRQITNGDSDSLYAEWSPDGRKIIFELDMPDSGQIELMKPDGSDTVDISPAPGWQPATQAARTVARHRRRDRPDRLARRTAAERHRR
jgi:hypothetical protein